MKTIVDSIKDTFVWAVISSFAFLYGVGIGTDKPFEAMAMTSNRFTMLGITLGIALAIYLAHITLNLTLVKVSGYEVNRGHWFKPFFNSIWVGWLCVLGIWYGDSHLHYWYPSDPWNTTQTNYILGTIAGVIVSMWVVLIAMRLINNLLLDDRLIEDDRQIV